MCLQLGQSDHFDSFQDIQLIASNTMSSSGLSSAIPSKCDGSAASKEYGFQAIVCFVLLLDAG